MRSPDCRSLKNMLTRSQAAAGEHDHQVEAVEAQAEEAGPAGPVQHLDNPTNPEGPENLVGEVGPVNPAAPVGSVSPTAIASTTGLGREQQKNTSDV